MTQTTESGFSLQHDAWGRLVLVDAAGERHTEVEPVRVFPISDPDGWISICDAQGRELASIKDPGELPAEVGKMLQAELARRDFVPVIERIVNVSTDSEPSRWKVETDRGVTTFLLNGEEDVRRLGTHGGLVIDVQGIRYLIRDTRQLDADSQRILERYL
jgi:hypothetical protein